MGKTGEAKQFLNGFLGPRFVRSTRQDRIRCLFRSVVMVGAFLLFSASAVFAIELEEAKTRGVIGETPSGYLAAVSGPTPEVQELINRINAERRARYDSIAQKNGTGRGAVESLAGRKAVEMTPAGQFVKGSNGEWKKK